MFAGFPSIAGLVGAQPLDRSALPPPDPLPFLAVQRSAALINSSSTERVYPVRVLVYGQSISQQEWAVTLLRNLQVWHPRSRFVTENRSISAFLSDYLLETAEADIYPFRPDLIVFHAYGGYEVGGAWERIQREFRTRTTADVITVGNHPILERDLTEPTVPGTTTYGSEAWLNYEKAPAVASSLGVCFPDTRSGLKAYLGAVGQPVKSILWDSIHFNRFGCDLQLALLRPYLCAPRVHPALDPMNNGRIQTHPVLPGVPGAARWVDGRLRFEFIGNRIDVVAAPGRPARCRVLVDGVPPTDLPSGMGHRRSSWWRSDKGFRPALLRVGYVTKPLPELWTLEVTSEDPDSPRSFRFSVTGSVTGPDGEGTSTNLFVSGSGRVRIDPKHWNMRLRPPQQEGAQIRWYAEARAVDIYGEGIVADPVVETVTTLANDLPDAAHVLELIAETPSEPPPIAALRVHHPGGLEFGAGAGPGIPPTLRVLATGREALAVWPADLADRRLLARDSLTGEWRSVESPPVGIFNVMTRQFTGETPMELLRLDLP